MSEFERIERRWKEINEMEGCKEVAQELYMTVRLRSATRSLQGEPPGQNNGARLQHAFGRTDNTIQAASQFGAAVLSCIVE